MVKRIPADRLAEVLKFRLAVVCLVSAALGAEGVVGAGAADEEEKDTYAGLALIYSPLDSLYISFPSTECFSVTWSTVPLL